MGPKLQLESLKSNIQLFFLLEAFFYNHGFIL